MFAAGSLTVIGTGNDEAAAVFFTAVMEVGFIVHKYKSTDFFDIGAIRQNLCAGRCNMIRRDIIAYLDHDLFIDHVRQRRIDRQRTDIRTANNGDILSFFCRFRRNEHGTIALHECRLLRHFICQSQR